MNRKARRYGELGPGPMMHRPTRYPLFLSTHPMLLYHALTTHIVSPDFSTKPLIEMGGISKTSHQRARRRREKKMKLSTSTSHCLMLCLFSVLQHLRHFQMLLRFVAASTACTRGSSFLKFSCLCGCLCVFVRQVLCSRCVRLQAFSEKSAKFGLSYVPLVSPTTTDDRIQFLASTSSSFLYCVSLTGVTGARTELPPDLSVFVKRVRGSTNKPLAVGFGISQPSQVLAFLTVLSVPLHQIIWYHRGST